ncbi:hypothetical protein BCh11DRAFT_07868 [Burkholderia sp. Ch1-1]|nr:hypothetical protein BCh11DRAFT_07868 [Burkholderia sp. Ch1-1]
MLFNAKSNVSGHLLRVHKDVLFSGRHPLWIGCVNIDGIDMIAASASMQFKGDRPNGLLLALGTTDPLQGGLGYYADVVPTSPFPGSGMRGYLKHYDRELEDLFEVNCVYATNADGTSRLDVTIKAVGKELARECKQARSMFSWD